MVSLNLVLACMRNCMVEFLSISEETAWTLTHQDLSN